MTYIGNQAGFEGQLYEMPVEELYKARLRADVKLIYNGKIEDIEGNGREPDEKEGFEGIAIGEKYIYI